MVFLDKRRVGCSNGGMVRKAKQLSATQVEAIFATFAAAEPHPKTELVAPNPFCLLVAIVLSAQATDVSVNKATVALFKSAHTPQEFIALGEAGLKHYIKTIGLFNAKAKNVMALCARLISEYGGQVPTTREALETLPGVGRKTANVWLNCALGQPTIGVDTHVFRVANRLGLCATKNPLATEITLEKAIPVQWKQHAHHWLILHGRYVCKARKPKCGQCVVRQWCRFPDKAH
jgi:endonuclease-3